MDKRGLADAILKLVSKFVMWLVDKYQTKQDKVDSDMSSWGDYYAKKRNARIDALVKLRFGDGVRDKEAGDGTGGDKADAAGKPVGQSDHDI